MIISNYQLVPCVCEETTANIEIATVTMKPRAFVTISEDNYVTNRFWVKVLLNLKIKMN